MNKIMLMKLGKDKPTYQRDMNIFLSKVPDGMVGIPMFSDGGSKHFSEGDICLMLKQRIFENCKSINVENSQNDSVKITFHVTDEHEKDDRVNVCLYCPKDRFSMFNNRDIFTENQMGARYNDRLLSLVCNAQTKLRKKIAKRKAGALLLGGITLLTIPAAIIDYPESLSQEDRNEYIQQLNERNNSVENQNLDEGTHYIEGTGYVEFEDDYEKDGRSL